MPSNLAAAVADHPYPDYQDWWPLGRPLLAMMASAITEQWRLLAEPQENLATVQATVDEYIQLVYAREARPALAASFSGMRELDTFASGEFDALSYSFYHSAFNALAARHRGERLSAARRLFTERVGARFFAQLADFLTLDLPPTLLSAGDFTRLEKAIGQVGSFLQTEGYLRTHFAFHFDVHTEHAGRNIRQSVSGLLAALATGSDAFALYEMGHPVILPSAVYLFQTVGEAQHHSSRTIEELFARVSCDARETEDFDPSGFSSDLVVELWEIRRRA